MSGPRGIEGPKVAIGSRLKGVDGVVTLGVKPNLEDYPEESLRLLREAPRIYYPTSFFAYDFTLMGKDIFPSFANYFYAGDKIMQTRLFQSLGIPHPRTRIYYARHHHEILKDFELPFVAKIPRSKDSGSGVFLIEDNQGLEDYLRATRVAYIQEYLPVKRDIRVVVIQGRVTLAYWRIAAPDRFQCNVAQGGQIDLSPVPDRAVELALSMAKKCNFNDVGIDILVHQGQCYALEANMRFGRQGFIKAGLDLKEIYTKFLREGVI